ncbi:MAG: hypothetical protein LBK61_07335 [Spirochaetaceae bacterium]|nr:hypothetical protein [Spirochaetaceae bacterium]
MRILPQFWPRNQRSAPAGSENPTGFHPIANHIRYESYPDSGRESAAGRQNIAMRRLCFPFGRAMPPHGGILPAGDDARLGKDEYEIIEKISDE